MTDYDGNDAIVVTLDYTNNSKEANSYLWSFVETVKQNGTELTGATIFLSEDFLRHCDRQPVFRGRAG